MNRIIITVFILLFSGEAFSQRATEDFKLSIPDQKVPGSLYNKIKFIDSRYDTSNFGIVQLGAFNRKARVIPQKHLSLQLSDVLAALIDSSAKDGELLLYVTQFNFAEVTGAMSEKGYCYVRAILYSLDGDRYKKLSGTDTVVLIKSMDVTRALFRNGSKLITDLISQHLLQSPGNTDSYSYSEVLQMDSIEKSTLKLYNSTEYADGIYTSYETFKRQVPDKQATAEMKDGRISSVKTSAESGKMEKVKSKNIYAIVYQGSPFIATEFGYYPLYKRNDDFYFTGKAKTAASSGDIVAASLFFGIIGGLIASNTADATFEMKIDHVNGGFIRLREIKTSTE